MVFDLRKFIGLLFWPFLFVVYYISGFWPRNPRRWVFGSWSGTRFADNTAALFEFAAAQKQDDIDVIWISKDSRIVKSLRERNFNAHLACSPVGIWNCLTAGMFVFDGLTRDVNHWLSRNAKRIQLRHGTGIKVMERGITTPKHRLYQLFHGNILQRFFWSYVLPWHTVVPDFSTNTSETHMQQGALYYGMQTQDMAITGFPRNDQLMSASSHNIDTLDHAWIEEAQREGQQVFLYLPTFRDDDVNFVIPWQELNDLAGRAGIRLLIKLHLVDAIRGIGSDVSDTQHLRVADPTIDCNSLFKAVDGLISDYSSATFDFILTRKPVIFFVPDLSAYLSNSRSFYFNFDDVTPGPKVETTEALEQALIQAVVNGIGEEWREQYDAVLDLFHVFRDANASERTYHEIRRRFLGIEVPEGVAKAKIVSVVKDNL